MERRDAPPPAAAEGPGRRRVLRHALLASLALVGVVAAGTLLLAAFRATAGEVVLAHTEGVNFVSAERLAEGGFSALYPAHPESSRPYLISPYGPLLYVEWVAARKLLGRPDSLAPGRLVALSALVACLGLLWALLRRTVTDRRTALLFTLVPLASPFVIESAAIGIADVAGLAWVGLGLLLAGRAAESRGHVWPAAVAFALALLTKQSLVAGLLAAALYLLLEGQARRAGALVSATLGLALAPAAAFEALTGGGLSAATVGGLTQPLARAQLGFLLPYLFRSWLFWPLLALSLTGLAGFRSASRGQRLALLYSASALAIALATLGKVGSSTNYFIEPVLALCWSAAVGFERLAALAPRAGAAALVLVTAAALPAAPDLLRRARSLTDYRELIAGAEHELGDRDLDGWVLSGVDLFPIVERRGGVVYLNDSYLYGLFWEAGRWPIGGFRSDVACGRLVSVLPPVVPARPAGARWGMYWEDWSFWNSPAVVPPILAGYEPAPGPAERIVPVLKPRPEARCPAAQPGPAAAPSPQPMSPASRNEK
ncbi:MAG TPA: glycosyltransferase family 39 protein [Gemmatimonadota bacterium]